MTQTARTVVLWVIATAAAVVAATVGVQAVTSPEPVPFLTAGQDDLTPDATATATTDDNPSPDDNGSDDNGSDDNGTDDNGTGGHGSDDVGFDDNGGDDHSTPDDNPTSHSTPDDDPTDDATDDDDGSSNSDGTVVTRTASSIGGSAAFEFDGTTIKVLWSTPEPGFHVEIHRDAPGDVDVRFESDSHESRIKADNENGTLRIRVEERVED